MRRSSKKAIRGFAAAADLRAVTKRAEKDVARGLKDTDCRGAAARKLKRR